MSLGKKTFAVTALAALSLTALTGCSSGEAESSEAFAECDETFTIAFSHPVGEASNVKAVRPRPFEWWSFASLR